MPLLVVRDPPIKRARAEWLDALRLALAFWVLAAHVLLWGRATTPEWLYAASRGVGRLFQPAVETHPAVLAFIVLSGYCIHRNGLRPDRFDLGSYGIRRVFRIVPIFVLASLAGVLVAVWLLGDPTISLRRLLLKLLGVSAFVPSLNTATYQGNAPLHTVMVEIWLYAAYPLGIYALMRRTREAHLWIGLALVTIAGIALCRRSPAMTNWWHNGSFAGFLIYWWIGAWFVSGSMPARVLKIAGLAWLVLTVLLVTGAVADLYVVEAKKLCFALLIGAAIRALDRPAGVSFGRWGQAGYSLYAFHTPACLAIIALGQPWWVAMLGALLVGFLAHRLIEAPCTEFGRTLAQRHAPGIQAAEGAHGAARDGSPPSRTAPMGIRPM